MNNPCAQVRCEINHSFQNLARLYVELALEPASHDMVRDFDIFHKDSIPAPSTAGEVENGTDGGHTDENGWDDGYPPHGGRQPSTTQATTETVDQALQHPMATRTTNVPRLPEQTRVEKASSDAAAQGGRRGDC